MSCSSRMVMLVLLISLVIVGCDDTHYTSAIVSNDEANNTVSDDDILNEVASSFTVGCHEVSDPGHHDTTVENECLGGYDIPLPVSTLEAHVAGEPLTLQPKTRACCKNIHGRQFEFLELSTLDGGIDSGIGYFRDSTNTSYILRSSILISSTENPSVQFYCTAQGSTTIVGWWIWPGLSPGYVDVVCKPSPPRDWVITDISTEMPLVAYNDPTYLTARVLDEQGDPVPLNTEIILSVLEEDVLRFKKDHSYQVRSFTDEAGMIAVQILAFSLGEATVSIRFGHEPLGAAVSQSFAVRE